MFKQFPIQISSNIDCKNLFLFKSKTKDGQAKQIALDYSPVYSEALGCMVNTVPIFNNDSQPSQPGFILKVDQPMHLANSLIYQMQFQNKLEEMGTKNSNLFVPKPKGTSLYCNVCKEHISDYLQHSESKTHKLKFKKNKFIKRISAVVDEFKKEQSVPQTALNLPHQTSDCVVLYMSAFEESNDHHDTTQCEPHTVKKVKLNDYAVNKMDNSISSNLVDTCCQQQQLPVQSTNQFNDKCQKQCL